MVSESEKTSGIVLPWEQKAIRGEEIPKDLSYPDQILFLMLRSLYDQVRKGVVTRETAVVEKKKLLDEYRVYSFREQMGEQWVEVIKNTDLARSEYRKNRTLENADKLVAIIEGRDLDAKLSQSL